MLDMYVDLIFTGRVCWLFESACAGVELEGLHLEEVEMESAQRDWGLRQEKRKFGLIYVSVTETTSSRSAAATQK
jgi:hypothetical protein